MPVNPCHSLPLHFESFSSLPWLRMHLQGKELSADKVFFIFTTVGLSRAPLGGVAMGFSAVVDGLTAFRRLNAFVNASDWSMTALAWQMSMSCERTGFVKAKEQNTLDLWFGGQTWKCLGEQTPFYSNFSNLVPLLIATLEASLIFIRRTFWMTLTTMEPAPKVRRCASVVLFLTASAATWRWIWCWSQVQILDFEIWNATRS